MLISLTLATPFSITSCFFFRKLGRRTKSEISWYKYQIMKKDITDRTMINHILGKKYSAIPNAIINEVKRITLA
jgi:hypothetical protein